MDHTVYKVLHLLGVMLLFFSLGGLTLHAMNGGDPESNKSRKLVVAFHGVAMLLLLVAGFGALAKLNLKMGQNPWVFGKLAVWLLMGAAPVVLKKKPELGKPLFFALPILGVVAAALAVFRVGAA